MDAERAQRRLAAILAADMVGFSRLMEADEAGTLARLRQARAEVLDPAFAEFGGRIVKTTGDGLLVEFGSAVDAVCCAVAVQEAMAARGGGIALRMGINLGDVVADGEDIYGDGVNIAARLEGLAPPGGIAISNNVHEHIGGRVSATFDDAGEQRVKNISRPVRVWQWRSGTESGGEVAPPAGARRSPGGRRPVVAVLPFGGARGDAEVEALAEGLADDLTTEFSRRRGIEVIARGTTAGFAGASGDLSAVGKAAGADYVLTGALRRSGDRLRITAELVHAASGVQVWSNRYDHVWGDVFALEDDLTERIAAAARWAMNAYEGRQYEDQPDEALGNAERRAKAAAHLYKFTAADFAIAERLLDRVLADDPDDAMALTMQAFTIAFHAFFGVHPPDAETTRRVLAMVDRAIELDRSSDYAYETRGLLTLHLRGDREAALADAERALAISPGYGLAQQLKAEALIYSGELDEGIALLRKTLAFDPRDPVNYVRYWILAMGQFLAGDYAAALAAIEQAQQGVLDMPAQDLARAAILSKLGRTDAARDIIGRILARWPDATATTVRQPLYKDAAARQAFLDALRDAGLPG